MINHVLLSLGQRQSHVCVVKCEWWVELLPGDLWSNVIVFLGGGFASLLGRERRTRMMNDSYGVCVCVCVGTLNHIDRKSVV